MVRVLVQAPASAPELVNGKSLTASRSSASAPSDIQRLYFQRDPTEDRIPGRTTGSGNAYSSCASEARTASGCRRPVIEQTVLPFRSFVQTPLRHRRLLLAGDAGHTVPPTGAKGLNLALADVRALAEVIEQTSRTGDLTSLDA